MAVEARRLEWLLTARNDTGAAFRDVERNMRSTESAATKLKAVLGTLGVGLSVGALAAVGRDRIQSVAALDDFTERTGIAVERASQLQQVMHISGTSIQEVEGFVIKLNKALAGADDDESKGAAGALRQIGLSADELRKKDPSIILRDIAGALDKFSDEGGGKSAVLGNIAKGGAQLLPFFKDLASEVGISARVTAEQAAQAEELEKTFRRLTNIGRGLSTEITNSLVPSLTRIGQAMLDARRGGEGFFSSLYEGAKRAAAEILRLNTAGDLNRVSEQIINQVERILRLEATSRNVPAEVADARLQKERAALKVLTDRRDRLEQILKLETKGFNLTDPPPKPRLDVSPDPARRQERPFDYVGEVFKDATAELQKLAAERQRAIDSLLAGTDQAKTDRLQTSLALLDDEFFRGAIGAKQYDQAVQQLLGRMEAAVDDTTELAALIAQTDFGKTEQLLRKVGIADRALFEGRINENVHNQIIKNLTEVHDKNKTVADDVTEFWRSAAESMQSSMSDLFFDVMQGQLTNLGAKFKSTIDRMVADNLAAKASTALFGADFGRGGQLGGLIGNAGARLFGSGGTQNVYGPTPSGGNLDTGGFFSWLMGLFRADGGPVYAGNPYIVGERGPELFVPQQSGTVVANGQFSSAAREVNVHIHQSFHGAVDRRSSTQAAADAARAAQIALARNG